MISLERQVIISEARKWIGTSFHHEARVLGAGVDCGQLLIAVYGAHGYMPLDYKLKHYSPDFAIHRDEEWYLSIVETFAKRVEVPGPADIVLYKFGRLFSHGGIVTEWPNIVHAWIGARQVLEVDAERLAALVTKERRFYSPFKDA